MVRVWIHCCRITGWWYIPPILFLGFASTIVPFAYAIAGLMSKKHEWVKPHYHGLLFQRLYWVWVLWWVLHGPMKFIIRWLLGMGSGRECITGALAYFDCRSAYQSDLSPQWLFTPTYLFLLYHHILTDSVFYLPYQKWCFGRYFCTRFYRSGYEYTVIAFCTGVFCTCFVPLLQTVQIDSEYSERRKYL